MNFLVRVHQHSRILIGQLKIFLVYSWTQLNFQSQFWKFNWVQFQNLVTMLTLRVDWFFQPTHFFRSRRTKSKSDQPARIIVVLQCLTDGVYKWTRYMVKKGYVSLNLNGLLNRKNTLHKRLKCPKLITFSPIFYLVTIWWGIIDIRSYFLLVIL